MILLHVGCGGRKYKNFINTDKDTLDISKSWPYEDSSVDGITSMAVLQQLGWKDLMFAFGEMYRVLKPGGAMRAGVHLVEMGYPKLFLYGDNINLFSFELLENILVERLGFSSIKLCKKGETSVPGLARADSRQGKGVSYIEAVK